ncbi:MAG: glycosidase [Candidatus Kerfeldbacteria bacterium]|nr:glycosidase [Candidatus Kerfeldbacteria bacterium]
MVVQLERFPTNPLLAPTTNWWECRAVFNAGVAQYQGKIHLLYRAVGQDGVSRFGLAVSHDGVSIAERTLTPMVEPGYNDPYERCGCEDPRITFLGGVYYVTYTAVSLYPRSSSKISSEAPWRTRVALLTTTDFKTFLRHGLVFSDDRDDKDAALFPEKVNGRYYIIHRRDLAMVLASSTDLHHWQEEGRILEPTHSGWQNDRVGVGAPPILTELGWLILYHGRDSQGVYRLGALVVDAHDPRRVVARLPEPLLDPREDYERMGVVANVVFTCGLAEVGADYLIYYGGADKVLAGARIAKATLLDALRRSSVTASGSNS